MRGLIRIFAAAALMLIMIALPSGGRAVASKLAAPTGATVAIAIQDFRFAPKTGAANVGDTVTWTNTGATAHTVTASDGSWDSGNLVPGASFSHTFGSSGSFNYYCMYHGSANGAGMAGTIVVAPSGGATPTSGADATPTSAAASPTAVSGPIPSVDARDQPAGSSLIVAHVVAAQDGWITVHANTINNQPGEQLGHSAVRRGDNYNVRVLLNPVPQVGDKVWPMLHIDAGVIGVYEFPGPDAPVILNGNIVMQQITLTAPPTPGPRPTHPPTQATPTAGVTMTPAPLPATPTAGVAMTGTQTMATPTAGTVMSSTETMATPTAGTMMAASPSATTMTPTTIDRSGSIGGRPGLPRTGAGDQNTINLWLAASLAALLIVGGVLLLKRRTT